MMVDNDHELAKREKMLRSGMDTESQRSVNDGVVGR